MREKSSLGERLRTISVVSLLVIAALAFTAAPVTAQSTSEQCQGTPQMSQQSIALLDDTISADAGATVEANFRPEPTLPEECTVVADLEFSFSQSGFQFGGGSNWDQATTNLLVGTFEVRPGEIRDIRAQLYTNGAEPGDEVTVVADYELWYKGNRDNSVQQNGIRRTITVEATNPGQSTPTGDSQVENTPISDPPKPISLDFLSSNLGIFMVFTLALVAVVGLVFRKPIVTIMTGGN